MPTHSILALSLAIRGTAGTLISTGEALVAIADGLEREPAPVSAVQEEGPPGLLGRTQLATRLGVSLATIDRACLQGCPFELVGTRRRFDLAAVRAWFAARGKTSTAPERRDPAVDAAAKRGGLRVAR